MSTVPPVPFVSDEARASGVVSQIERRLEYILAAAGEAVSRHLGLAADQVGFRLRLRHLEQFRAHWAEFLPAGEEGLRMRIEAELAARHGDDDSSDEESRFEVAMAALRWVSVRGGDWVVRHGEASALVYVVVSGRLRVVPSVPSANDRPNHIEVGEIAGELELFTGSPYRVGLRAAWDSELISLPREVLIGLADQDAQLWKRIAVSTAHHFDRLVTTGLRRRDETTLIALLSCGEGGEAFVVGRGLQKALSVFASTVCITSSSVDADLGPGASGSDSHDERDTQLRQYLERKQAGHRYVLFPCDNTSSNWNRRCYRQADRLFFTSRPESIADLNRYVESTRAETYELIVVHREGKAASKPSSWSIPKKPQFLHQVTPGVEKDFARLARMIAGRGLGVVLGGGGARGLAHIGVLRAFQEYGLEIDAIGGTSMGACIAGQRALGWDYQHMIEASREAFTKSSPLWDYTLPLVSLLSGKHVSRTLRTLFGDVCIEDLPVVYYAVSSDLMAGRPVVHREGPLWRAVRASSSVAGVLPPVTDSGRLLVDGGVLDNLPVSTMAAIAPGVLIAAIDVNPYGVGSFIHAAEYGESIGLRGLLQSRNPFKKTRRLPSIQAILERVTMLGSVNQVQSQQGLLAMYIHPPTDEIGFLDMKRIEETADLGYRFARLEIENWLEHQPAREFPAVEKNASR